MNYKIFCRTLHLHHYVIKKGKESEKEIQATKMAQSLPQHRSQDFWKEFHRNKSRIDMSNEVDGKTGSDDISELFTEKKLQIVLICGYNEKKMQDALTLYGSGKCGYNHLCR